MATITRPSLHRLPNQHYRDYDKHNLHYCAELTRKRTLYHPCATFSRAAYLISHLLLRGPAATGTGN